MKRWVLSGFQKERIFSKVGQMKAKLREQQQCIECMSIQIKMLFDELHARQERVREARELLKSMKALLVCRTGRSELTDRVSRFIEEEECKNENNDIEM